MATVAAQVQQLVELLPSLALSPEARLEALIQDVPPEIPENFKQRAKMLERTRELMLRLERPDNSIERITFAVWEMISLHIAIDLGILKLFKEKSPRTVDELAELTKASPLLLARLLRCLASFNFVVQESLEKYSATKFIGTFTTRKYEAAILASCFLAQGWIHLPHYLQNNGYKNPTSHTDTAFSYAFKEPGGASIWDLLAKSSHGEDLWVYMSSYHDGHKSWMEVYPYEEQLLAGAKKGPKEVTMVDVGGGLGYMSKALKAKAGDNVPGRIVVQDLESVIPKALQGDGVEYMAHSFFDEQPIKGARFYFMRWVLHDWPQDIAIKIVTRLREAMTPGYSKLIINEWIVPEPRSPTYMPSQDLNMMSIGGGMERTKEMHVDYIEKAGLKVVAIWTPNDKVSESVIEAELPL